MGFIMKIRFIILVIVALLFGFSISSTTQENIREEKCIGYNNNYFISPDGNIWKTYRMIQNNKEYTVYFSDNNTPEIYDDIIIDFQ